MNIAFIAYYFAETDGVGSLRSRCLARILEQRDNNLYYFTKNSFGKLAAKFSWVWNIILFYHLLRVNVGKVYVSCGPFGHLLFILLACHLSRKHFICDFRDPWSFNIRRGYGNPSAKINSVKIVIAEWIEKLIYKLCYRFWVCTPGMYQLYAELFKDDTKLDMIPNGYDFDPEIIGNFEASKNLAPNPDKLHLVCLGKFAEENPITAKKALTQLKEFYRKNGSDSLAIDFIGTPVSPTGELLREVKLEKISTFHPKMSYLEAIKIAAKANMGLCVIRDEKFDLGTKAFDYIGLGLPIYNCFQNDSNFSQFFSNFLSRDRSKRLNPDLIKNYRRSRLFEKYLIWIDGKDN